MNHLLKTTQCNSISILAWLVSHLQNGLQKMKYWENQSSLFGFIVHGIPGGSCCCFLGDVGDRGVIGWILLEAGGLPGRLLGVSSNSLASSSSFLLSLATGQAVALQRKLITTKGGLAWFWSLREQSKDGSRTRKYNEENPLFELLHNFHLPKLIVIKTEAHPNCIGLSLNSVSQGKHETTKEMASQWNGLPFSFPGVLLVDLCLPQFHLNCICHLYLNRIWHNNIIVNWYVIFFLCSIGTQLN